LILGPLESSTCDVAVPETNIPATTKPIDKNKFFILDDFKL
jgi:hypothetical protein